MENNQENKQILANQNKIMIIPANKIIQITNLLIEANLSLISDEILLHVKPADDLIDYVFHSGVVFHSGASYVIRTCQEKEYIKSIIDNIKFENL
jgi:hypothetical protein